MSRLPLWLQPCNVSFFFLGSDILDGIKLARPGADTFIYMLILFLYAWRHGHRLSECVSDIIWNNSCTNSIM